MGTDIDLTKDEFKELADFWSEPGDALSVYFEAPAPSEVGHREEPLLAKEQIRQKLTSIPGLNPADRGDLHRVIETIATMRGNHGRTKVIFACRRQNFWREYDVPGDFGVRLDAGRSFVLAPLVAQQQTRRRYAIVLVDRNSSRLLILKAREIVEQPAAEDEDREKIRTTGARKSAHLERKKEEPVRQHVAKLFADVLRSCERGGFDELIVGCREELWPEIEAALHPDLKRVLAGRIQLDPGLATHQEISLRAQAIIDERDRKEEETLVDRVAGAAAADGFGALGFKDVIDALEKREVRALLFPDWPNVVERTVSLCSNCGHLAEGKASTCDLCAGQMRQFCCAQEALLRHALGRSIEGRVLHFSKLPPDQPIAAWLRFRAERSTSMPLAS